MSDSLTSLNNILGNWEDIKSTIEFMDEESVNQFVSSLWIDDESLNQKDSSNTSLYSVMKEAVKNPFLQQKYVIDFFYFEINSSRRRYRIDHMLSWINHNNLTIRERDIFLREFFQENHQYDNIRFGWFILRNQYKPFVEDLVDHFIKYLYNLKSLIMDATSSGTFMEAEEKIVIAISQMVKNCNISQTQKERLLEVYANVLKNLTDEFIIRSSSFRGGRSMDIKPLPEALYLIQKELRQCLINEVKSRKLDRLEFKLL